jgi:hypothetical protein
MFILRIRRDLSFILRTQRSEQSSAFICRRKEVLILSVPCNGLTPRLRMV